MKPASLLAIFAFVCAFVAVPAHAQTVVNPRTVEFDPSADHAAMAADGQPLVQRYDLQIFAVGASVATTTANLGKPSPQSDGKIRVDFSSLVSSWPLPDGNYEARVAAIGPTGAAASDPSNTFAFQSQGCSVTLGSASQSVPAGGGTGNVTVNASSSCAWTASSNAGWVVLATTSGTGAGSVGFTVTANTGTTARAAALTIGGQSFTITQPGPTGCTYSLSTGTLSFTSAGGLGTVTVTTGSTCGWVVTGATSWLTVNTASGSGTGVASFSVAANESTTGRAASLTIGGQTLNVSQAAAACGYSVTPPSQSFTEAGGTGSVTVTSGSGCGWTAASNASWVTVGTSSGSGGTTFYYTVAANSLTSPRTASITVGGQTVTITQAASPCGYSLSSASQSFTEAGGAGTVAVTAGAGCSWTAASDAAWVAVSPPGGTGSASVSFTAAANPSASPRSATLTIAGKTFGVTQAGAGCTFTLSATSQSFSQGNGSGSVTVTCGVGCGWTATSNASWVTLTVTSGSGTGNVGYAVAKNTTTTARSATITVGGLSYTVSQAAANRPTAPKKVRLTTIIAG